MPLLRAFLLVLFALSFAAARPAAADAVALPAHSTLAATDPVGPAAALPESTASTLHFGSIVDVRIASLQPASFAETRLSRLVLSALDACVRMHDRAASDAGSHLCFVQCGGSTFATTTPPPRSIT